jgi:hypothetical protein
MLAHFLGPVEEQILGEGRQKLLANLQLKLPKLSGQLSNGPNPDPKKTISLGVLTLSSFEEAGQECSFFRIRQRQQSHLNLPIIQNCCT